LIYPLNRIDLLKIKNERTNQPTKGF